MEMTTKKKYPSQKQSRLSKMWNRACKTVKRRAKKEEAAVNYPAERIHTHVATSYSQNFPFGTYNR